MTIRKKYCVCKIVCFIVSVIFAFARFSYAYATHVNWGNIANDNLEGKKIATVVYFPGDVWAEHVHTANPLETELTGSSIEEIRTQVRRMKAIGINTINISYWGANNAEGLQSMITRPNPDVVTVYARVIDVAKEEGLTFFPLIETGAGDMYQFWRDFPANNADLIHRISWWAANFGNKDNWLKVYNNAGVAKKAVGLIETIKLAGEYNKVTYKAGLDSVAASIKTAYNIDIGFSLDPTRLAAQTPYVAFGPYPADLLDCDKLLFILPWDISVDGNTDAARTSIGKTLLTLWKDYPVVSFVVPGYDASIVFPFVTIYGKTDYWRQLQSELADPVIGNAGISVGAWNGWAEWYHITFSEEDGSTNARWAHRLIKINNGINPDLEPPPIDLYLPNELPVAHSASVTTIKDTPVNITLRGLGADALTYAIVTQPTKGTLSGTAPNLTYTPTSGYAGADSFTFNVNDGTTNSAAAAFSITVLDGPPISITLVGDGTGYDDINQINHLSTNYAKPLDSDGDNVYGTLGSIFAGSSSVASGANLAFTTRTQPRANFVTSVNPGAAFRSVAHGLTGYGIIDTPSAAPGVNVANWNRNSGVFSTTSETGHAAEWYEAVTFTIDDTAPEVFRIGLMAGNIGGDWQAQGLRLVEARGASQQVVSLESGGNGRPSWVFFDINLNGATSGTFSVWVQKRSANNAGSGFGGMVFDTINSVPVAHSASVTTSEDTPVNITLAGSDVDGDALTYAILTQPTKGVFSGTAPNLTYTPTADANGSDSFTFRVNDGMVDSAEATVSITITPGNDAPVVTADPVLGSTTVNRSLTFDVSAIATDVDLDSLTISLTGTTSIAGGRITTNGKKLAYLPPADATATDDTFSCQVSDGKGGSATVNFEVDVTASTSGALIADPAFDYVSGPTMPAQWSYLRSDMATGGTEVALTSIVGLGFGGNTGFGHTAGAGGVPGVLGSIQGGAQYEIFTDGFNGDGISNLQGHEGLPGVDLLMHPGDGALANGYVIVRYAFDGADITAHGTTAKISGSFRDLCGSSAATGDESGSMVASVYLNNRLLWTKTGAAGRLLEADGTFDLSKGYTVKGGDQLSFVIGNNGIFYADESALRAAINLSNDAAEGDGFYAWIGEFPSLSDKSAGGDPDFDGTKNLLEYVLNGNPGTSDPEILPTLDASGDNFVFTFTRRAESADYTTQVFQYGSDLSGWFDLPIVHNPPQVAIGTPSGGLQEITVTLSKSEEENGKLFGRLKVTQP